MRERCFMLVSVLLDDNGQACGDTRPLLGTTSPTVAAHLVRAFLPHRNQLASPAWDDEIRRVLPGVLPEPTTLTPTLDALVQPSNILDDILAATERK